MRNAGERANPVTFGAAPEFKRERDRGRGGGGRRKIERGERREGFGKGGNRDVTRTPF